MKLRRPFEFSLSPPVATGKTVVLAFPLIRNAIGQQFGELILCERGTIWALPAFEDNAAAVTLMVSRLDELKGIRKTMEEINKKSPSPAMAYAENLHRDVFISHASEDKDAIARPLAGALRESGISVWFDEFEFKLGDSLRRKIEQGLHRSKHGLVIMSPDFFRKNWPQRELDALFALENEERRLLPVWHNLSSDDVRRLAPLLADRFAISSSQGVQAIVAEIKKALGQ